MRHAGRWAFHEDDCQCGQLRHAYCNRGAWVWSCCGACAEVSECTAPAMHPTYWQHPRHAETVLRYVHGRPIYRPPDELRQSMPELYRRDPAV